MNNDLLLIIFRSALVLVILFVLTKIMGKKQVSQMNMYDYVLGITIGSIAADISLDLEHDLIAGIVSLAIYNLSGVLVTYFSLKSLRIRKIFSGTPSILIEKGRILTSNLKKEGIDINNLEEEARLKGYFDLSKIDYAILETSGQISFLSEKKENNLNINLIQDGEVMYENLDYINKSIKWLDKKIKEKGYSKFSEVFLFLYKSDKEIFIYDYDEKH